MKFIFFGYDFMIPVVETLIKNGHALQAIYSFPCDNVFNFNRRAENLAKNLMIPFTQDPPNADDIKTMAENGCDVFFSAGYPYKIPPIPSGHYGINMHPTLLPRGRGLIPNPHMIMHDPDASGVTLHKLTDEFDAGDILWQQKLPLGENETVDELTARIALTALMHIPAIFDNFSQYWNNAAPQNKDDATHFPVPSETDRTLDFSAPNETLRARHRAFGKYGCIAQIEGHMIATGNLTCWDEKHDLPPGRLIYQLDPEMIVTTKDGFALIKNWQHLDNG